VPRGEVTFADIRFGYGSARPVFEEFSLHIDPGEHVGLVGVSGNGKTTLTHLLLRFLDVEAGAILVDGTDIRDVAQSDLRRHIGYVPQDPALFHRSIYENIAYGRPGASFDEVIEVARLAHADEFIDELPDGYATLVGERGVKLSGGQRQRIAIARAMLSGAPILVLDEATSALDSHSEALVGDALWRLMKDRTAIAIAHRLSTIAHLDRIVVLEAGQIVEQGSHQELVAHEHGVYGALWRRQSGGFLP
jgi:ABC-type multidrug transport system fused ATPase/permease subunit